MKCSKLIHQPTSCHGKKLNAGLDCGAILDEQLAYNSAEGGFDGD